MIGDGINWRGSSKGSAPGVQYSVFEAHLSRGEYQELKRAVERIIEPSEDSVRYYRLCGACADRIEVPAIGDVTPDPKTIVV